MTKRDSITTPRLPRKAAKGRSFCRVCVRAQICLGLLFFVMTPLGGDLKESLHLSAALSPPESVVTAAAGSKSSSVTSWPLTWPPGTRLNPRISQEHRTATTVSASEPPAPFDVRSPKAVWTRTMCTSAGAQDVEKCVEVTKMHAGDDAGEKPARAKVVGVLLQHFQDHSAYIDRAENENMNRLLLADPAIPVNDYEQSFSLLAASYVKFVEAGGHRVIPIPADASVSEYRKLFLSIDGLLLPGGSAAIHYEDAPYYQVTKLFLNWAVQANESGRYFPVLGICLGFEAMIIWGGGDNFSYFVADDYRNVDRARQLQILPAAKTSRLFGPDRNGTSYSPASAENRHAMVRDDNRHRKPFSDSDNALEHGSLSAQARELQSWPGPDETHDYTWRTVEDSADVAMRNVINKAMLIDLLSTQKTAYFHHTHRITRAEFERDAVLSSRFALLATVVVSGSSGANSDSDEEIAAIVESRQYPFYGFQFHPEKILFEHDPHRNVQHDAFSRWVANSLAFFFAHEVGKSPRTPTPFADEWPHFIQRHTPTDLSSPNMPYLFEQAYFFGKHVDSASMQEAA